MSALRVVPAQKARAIALFVYLFVLLSASRIAFGQWLPPADGGRAVWFYTGLASLLLGNHLVSPYFSKPVDAISYAVAAAAALYGSAELTKWSTLEKSIFYAAFAYYLLVLIVSFTAIFLRTSTPSTAERLSRSSSALADAFGNQRIVFGVTIFVALYLFHRDSAQQTLLIAIACIVAVLARPDEVLAGLLTHLVQLWRRAARPTVLGELIGVQFPSVLLVRQVSEKQISIGSGVAIRVTPGPVVPAIALDTVGRDQMSLLRCIEAPEFSVACHTATNAALRSIPLNTMTSLALEDDTYRRLVEPILTKYRERLTGIVATDTSSDRLYFEIITNCKLQQGMLVEVTVQDTPVVYQVLDGLTKEEVVYQKNMYGFARGQAKKIGIWNDLERKFTRSNWFPHLNAPCFVTASVTAEPNEQTLGVFPGGHHPVQLGSLDEIVTHNTAILGILGVGKSMLAIELVERLIANGTKVIVLDLTDQYATELGGFFDPEAERIALDAIVAAGELDNTRIADSPEDGGSLPNLEAAVLADLRHFLVDQNVFRLKIYNPSGFGASRQASEPKSYNEDGKWKRGAALWSVTPVEFTRIVTQAALTISQTLGPTTKARVCVVYEEAHSLIPEWNSVAVDTDRHATSGTARAILQGRKFGLGCLLITQRTANVTKTILNQCNTMFAMRTFDDTGKAFLANYVGSEYADMLSTIPERHAVFFGRGSSCENPILIELNAQQNFRDRFRTHYPAPGMPLGEGSAIADAPATRSIGARTVMSDLDDDIPF